MERWKTRAQAGFSGVVPVETFFSKYMKGKGPPSGTIDQITTNTKTQVKAMAAKFGELQAGEREPRMYDPFLKYLQAVVKRFPEKTKPLFAKTAGVTINALHHTDHNSRPDLSGSLPSLAAPSKWEWHHIGTVVEFKARDDLFDSEGKIKPGQLENVVQLIKSARSILMASGFCYSFVVSVFNTQARLFRVDRSGYIVSEAFDWAGSRHIFPEFYWRLYNGGNDNRMLGEDDTLTVPTEGEKSEMYAHIVNIPAFHSLSFIQATGRSRWVEVNVGGGKTKKCFTVGSPIFQSKGLFCRGTRVDRVLIPDDSTTEVYALKDAWRQSCRQPESDFYAVIQDYIDQELGGEMPKGLTACVGSHQLATLNSDIHRTTTAELRGGHRLQDREHDRSLLKDVGFPLSEYTNTKQLVRALRDAIAGHEIALKAGVLHRDISVGNVLICGDTSEEGPHGFVLDWDYSEFTTAGLETLHTLGKTVVEDLEKHLKDVTGTYPFLSIADLQYVAGLLKAVEQPDIPVPEFRHACKHDLESFYWLLIWVLLRHANHSLKATACSTYFGSDDIDMAIGMKGFWIGTTKNRLPIDNNAPLSELIDALTTIFYHQGDQGFSQHVDATHETVLAAFDTALLSEGWPEGDKARPFVLQAAKNDSHMQGTFSISTHIARPGTRSAAQSGSLHLPLPSLAGSSGSNQSTKRRREVDDGGRGDGQKRQNLGNGYHRDEEDEEEDDENDEDDEDDDDDEYSPTPRRRPKRN
ncbi:hypothetical protein C8J57DRAFT_1172994 [Mycena rebaudengoi]|nr:hypothetical protein C8J57DRAFT_1172994 [Mycena rebaudengoi]